MDTGTLEDLKIRANKDYRAGAPLMFIQPKDLVELIGLADETIRLKKIDAEQPEQSGEIEIEIGPIIPKIGDPNDPCTCSICTALKPETKLEPVRVKCCRKLKCPKFNTCSQGSLAAMYGGG